MTKQVRSKLARSWLALVLTAACSPSFTPPKAASITAKKSVVVCAFFRTGRNGPVCVRPLTPEEASRHHLSWNLTTENGRVISATQRNSRGFPESDDDGQVSHDYVYDASGLSEVRSFDRLRHLVMRMVISNQGRRVEYRDEWGRMTPEGDTWHTSEVRSYDAHGFVSEARSFGLDGKPIRSSLGAYAVRYQRDERGLELEACYFDAAGNPMTSRWGVHCVVNQYDDYGNAIKTHYEGTDRKPTPNVNDVYSGTRTTDEFGNITSVEWYGADGKLAAMRERAGWCASIRWHFVEGLRVGGDCLDASNSPWPFRAGSAYWRDTYDARGRLIESRWFGSDGAPFLGNLAARLAFHHDNRDIVNEKHYFLEDGTPGQKRGPAVVRTELDGNGLLKTERYFDAAGQPSTRDDCARRDYEWDRYRQLTSISCLNAEGHPAEDDSRVSIQIFRYFASGLMAEKSFFDTDGKPVEDDSGVARVTFAYDAQGRESSRNHFDIHGKVVPRMHLRSLRARFAHAAKGILRGDRDQAFANLQAARKKLLAGEDFDRVALTYSDQENTMKHPGDDFYADTKRAFPAARFATESLKIGEVSEIVELPAGLFLYQRIE